MVAKPHILLGVSGGIAAYKAAALTSTLVQRGDSVDVVMTAEAERFVSPLTFASLTGRAVYTSLWDLPERIPHIRLVREAQVALVVPATANLIAKLAAGIADDLLTAALLAARIPRILAPAMNEAMYEDPATQANISALRARGYEIVDPERGFLAERELGVGRLASEDQILQALDRALSRRLSLKGKRVAILSGGELTVTVRGNGRGGPNQEYALALADLLKGTAGIAAIAGDTDGADGGAGEATDPAGALIDGSTFAKMKAQGLDPRSYLENNDATAFFAATGDLLLTGPTLTNVNDVRVILVD